MTNINNYNYERYLNNDLIERKVCQSELYGYIIIENQSCDYYFMLMFKRQIEIFHVNKACEIDDKKIYCLNYDITDTLIYTLTVHCDLFNSKRLWNNDDRKPRTRYYNNSNLYVDAKEFIGDFINETICIFNL